MAGTDWTGLSAFVTSLSLFVTSVGGLILRFVFRWERDHDDDDDDGQMHAVSSTEEHVRGILDEHAKRRKARRGRHVEFTARLADGWRLT